MASNINIQGHPFHLVDPSPWPFTGAFGALTTTCGAVMYMHGYVGGGFTLTLGFILIILTMAGWWRDIFVRVLLKANIQKKFRLVYDKV